MILEQKDAELCSSCEDLVSQIIKKQDETNRLLEEIREVNIKRDKIYDSVFYCLGRMLDDLNEMHKERHEMHKERNEMRKKIQEIHQNTKGDNKAQKTFSFIMEVIGYGSTMFAILKLYEEKDKTNLIKTALTTGIALLIVVGCKYLPELLKRSTQISKQCYY